MRWFYDSGNHHQLWWCTNRYAGIHWYHLLVCHLTWLYDNQLTEALALGVLHTVLSLTASMDSVPFSSRPHFPSAEPSLLDSLLPNPQIPGKRYPEPRSRLFGVSAFFLSSTSSSSVLLFPKTALFTTTQVEKVDTHPLSLLSN